MLEQIRQWFKPPTFPDDEEKTRNAQILYTLLASMLVFLLFGVLITIFTAVQKTVAGFLILGGLVWVLISRSLARGGHILTANRIFIVGTWVIFTIGILLTGRINTTLVSFQLALAVIAIVLLERRTAIFLTLLSILVGLGLTIFESIGYPLVHFFVVPPMAAWGAMVLAFLMVLTPLTPTIQNMFQTKESLRESEEKFRTLLDWTYDWELWVSPQGKLIYCSSSCERVTGWSPDDFLSNAGLKRQLVHPDSLDAFQKHYEFEHDAMSGSGKIEYRIIARDGSEHWIEHACRPLFGANDRYLGRRVSNRDITERKQIDAALLESEIKFRTIFENSIDAIGVSKMAKHIFVNPAYVALFGYGDNEELIGKPVLELIAPDSREQIIQNIHRRAIGGPAPSFYETRGLRKDGKSFDLEVHVSTFELQEEMFTLVIERDITERKAFEKALRESEARNRAILNALPDLMFVQNRDGTYLDYHATNQSDLYTSPEHFLGKKVHDVLPEELAVTFLASIEQAIITGEMQIFTYELTIAGQIRFFEARIMQQDNDKVVSMIRETTERKQVEEQEHKQRNIAEALSNSAAALNSTLKFNEVLERVLDSVGQVVPHDASNIMLLDVDGNTLSIACHRGYVEHGAKIDEIERQFSLETMPILVAAACTGQSLAIPDTQTDPTWAIFPATKWVRSYLTVPIQIRQTTVGFLNLDSETAGFFNIDHAERLQAFANHAAIAINNAQLYEDMKIMAVTDPLTAIYNRAFFETELARIELGRDFPVSIIVADLDNLKTTNDVLGHLAGDELIKSVAQILRETFRAADIIARIGGDEFAVLLPKTHSGAAEQMLSRVRVKIIEHSAVHPQLPIRLSLGAATAEQGKLIETYRLADQRMYEDKAKHKSSK